MSSPIEAARAAYLAAEPDRSPSERGLRAAVDAALAGQWIKLGGHTHPERFRHCPHCGADVMRAALVDVAYVMDLCDCPAAEYQHLAEQMWHREHLAAMAGEDLVAKLAERDRLIATGRRRALADAHRAVMAEARKGAGGAPSAQHVTYPGGLRRAAKLIDWLLGKAMEAEEASTGE
jgi:hypothetical protein